jgi:hypothetical protein
LNVRRGREFVAMASQPGGFVDKSFEPRTLDEHDLSRGLRVSTGHID